MIPREPPVLALRGSSRLAYIGWVLACVAGMGLIGLVPMFPGRLPGNPEFSGAFIGRFVLFLIVLTLILALVLLLMFALRLALSGMSLHPRLVIFPSGLFIADQRHGIGDFIAWQEIRRISVPSRATTFAGRMRQDFWQDDLKVEFTNGHSWDVSLQLLDVPRRQLIDSLSQTSGASGSQVDVQVVDPEAPI